MCWSWSAWERGLCHLVVLVLVLLVLVYLAGPGLPLAHGFVVLVLDLLVLVYLAGPGLPLAHGFVTAEQSSAPRPEGPAEGPHPTCIAPKRAQGV